MADTLRIKRRAATGLAGAPASLAAAEIAYNEKDDTLYYGKGDSGGLATTVLPIAGPGTFAPLNSPALTGTPTAPTATGGTSTTQLATTAFVTNAVVAAGGAAPSNAIPLVEGVPAAGTSALYSRADHVHPRGPAVADVSDTAPSSPVNGQLWFKSNAGKLMIFIVDANSSQWVQVGGAEVNR
jgi:hypothetical protein